MAPNIIPVAGSRGTLRFIKAQWAFYEDDPNWVPPLIFDRKKLLDTAKNPFWKHSGLGMFIAERDGRTVGRIAAITNESHNAVHEDKVGFFGFFECENNQETAGALFDAARGWLKERGMNVMRGPMNPSINDELGMLIDGFDTPPMILMTHNPRYYPALCDGYGFKKVKDLYAYFLDINRLPVERLDKMHGVLMQRFNLSIRELDFGHMKEEMLVVKELYNTCWEKNWGAVATTDAEFEALASDLVQVLGTRFRSLVFIVERDGAPIGFALCLPNINQLLMHNRKGHLLPGVFRLFTQAKRINQLRIIVLGLLPEHRNKGIDALMYDECMRRGEALGINTGEASWVLEDNMMMNRGAELLNAERYKTYRIYDIGIA
jgi:GNAT superfamily N-acetyltransferase